jgi:hypothetical protein
MQSMRAGLSFSHSPISLLLRQPLSIKKSYAGAIHPEYVILEPLHCTVFFIKHEGALVFYLTIGKAGRHAAVEY